MHIINKLFPVPVILPFPSILRYHECTCYAPVI